MKFLLLCIAAVLMGFAWLSPFHSQPWATFSSEISSFFAGVTMLAACSNQPLKIPKIQLWIFPVIFVPLIQWACGLVFDFGVAFITALYLLSFWLMIVLGYNLASQQEDREKLMQYISYLILSVAVLSSFMAITQWLGLSVKGVMLLEASRPYANFGQPNNLATFLSLGVIAGLYLYEKYKISFYLLIPANLVIFFAMGLSQSRTAWVIALFIGIYWIYKQAKNTPRLGFAKLCAWAVCCGVMMTVAVPVLTYFVGDLTQNVVVGQSVLERAGSGYERFDIWMQMLLALKEQPWFGYGWSQTSVAQMLVFHLHPTHTWVSSAHNVLLDLLIWNGIPLGLLIITYMAIWLLWLNKNAKDTVSIVAFLMVGAILTHAMLEFPQRYAYFLLPMAFLLGMIQAQTNTLQSIVVDKNISRIYSVIFVVLILLIWRDYKICHHMMASWSQQQLVKVKVLGSSRVVFLTQFEDLTQWGRFNPFTQMSDDQLTMVGNIVKKNPTMYNLFKYSAVLVYNHKYAEAEHQLFILNYLYKKNISVAELMKLSREARVRP